MFDGTRAVGVQVDGATIRRARGDPLRRGDQLAAAPAALRGRRSRGTSSRSASASSTTFRASARTSRTTSRSTSSAPRTQPVTVAPRYKWRNRPLVGLKWLSREEGPGRDEPLRGGRLHPLERRRRLSERDVPLPADRGPIRRHRAAGARLSAACRPDVLRRARLGADHLRRSAGEARAPLQLPVDRSRTGGSGSSACGRHGRSSTRPHSSRSTAASSRRGRRSSRTSEILDWVARDAETALHPSCTCAMGTGSSTRLRCACTASTVLRVVDASACSRSSRTGTSTRR